MMSFQAVAIVAVHVLLCARETYARSGGAPAEACSNLTPNHGSAQTSNNPYMIDLSVFDDGSGNYFYQPGNTYQLVLQHEDGTTPFRGFFIQGRLMADDSTQVGTFSDPPDKTRLSSCLPNNIGITHDLDGLSGTDRDCTSVTVTWTAPPEGTGPIRFGYAVVRVYSTFWANDRTEQIQEAIDCGSGDLNDPTDGQVNFTTTTFNSTATYECDTGYNFQGMATRTCQADGTWSGSEPTCQIVDCGSGDLNDPTDGQVIYSTTTFNSTATYECDTGYNLQGMATRTCQTDGTWSYSEPTCQSSRRVAFKATIVPQVNGQGCPPDDVEEAILANITQDILKLLQDNVLPGL